jgi:hypothetical protein
LFGKSESEATLHEVKFQQEDLEDATIDLKLPEQQPKKGIVIEEIDTRMRLDNGKIVPDHRIKTLKDGALEITLHLPEIVQSFD